MQAAIMTFLRIFFVAALMASFQLKIGGYRLLLLLVTTFKSEEGALHHLIHVQSALTTTHVMQRHYTKVHRHDLQAYAMVCIYADIQCERKILLEM